MVPNFFFMSDKYQKYSSQMNLCLLTLTHSHYQHSMTQSHAEWRHHTVQFTFRYTLRTLFRLLSHSDILTVNEFFSRPSPKAGRELQTVSDTRRMMKNDEEWWRTLSKPEPVTGRWVYTEAVYLFNSWFLILVHCTVLCLCE